MIPFSVLDLAPITEGGNAADAFRQTLDLAQRAESWGYKRFWLAEHHGMPGIASAATAILIGHVAAGTKSMRVGAGGIMLPNHAPLVIAEQFGTLATLYGNRIDLGLGRAPGSDQLTARALRRNLAASSEEFPHDVAELLDYFSNEPQSPVRAVPGAGTNVPIWILGSSLFGARLAAAYGLPYAFASHFAPGLVMQAIADYREHFRASEYLARPYVMLGVNVVAAESDAEAELLSSSAQQAFVNLRTGRPGKLPPPVPGYFDNLAPELKEMLKGIFAFSAIGSPQRVKDRLEQLIRETQADELILSGHIYDHAARLRSYEIAADVQRQLGERAA